MLNKAPQNPIATVDTVGLAIKAVNPGQNHIGVLFLSGAEVALCHLAWHFDLRFEVANDSYSWVDLTALDPVNKRVAAAFFQTLRQEGPSIPYGFTVDGECFDQSGNFIPPPIGKGLTCATFVLAAFRAQGHNLLDRDTWPVREGDVSWQQHIHDMLTQAASPEHIEALSHDIGAARIKPEEVAAAGLFAPWPATFTDVEGMAAQILAELA